MSIELTIISQLPNYRFPTVDWEFPTIASQLTISSQLPNYRFPTQLPNCRLSSRLVLSWPRSWSCQLLKAMPTFNQSKPRLWDLDPRLEGSNFEHMGVHTLLATTAGTETLHGTLGVTLVPHLSVPKATPKTVPFSKQTTDYISSVHNKVDS